MKMSRTAPLFLLAAVLAAARFAPAQPPPSPSPAPSTPPIPQPWLELGGEGFTGWSGLAPGDDGSAAWDLQAAAVFRYPPGEKGWHDFGFTKRHDGTRDWRGYYGLRLEMLVPAGRSLQLHTALLIPPAEGRSDYITKTEADTAIAGSGDWATVTLPLAGFDFNREQSAFLQFIEQVQFDGKFADGRPGKVQLRRVRLVRAPGIALEAPIRGKSVGAGQSASYAVTLANCTDAPRDLTLGFARSGFDAMSASVEPARLRLAPGGTAACAVTVRVPDGDGKTLPPPGGHERQLLLARSGDATLAQLELITAREVARPSILHTPAEWEEVRDKVKRFDWAKKSQDNDYVKVAEAWQVPQPATPEQRAHGPEQHPYVFLNPDFEKLPKAAIAWQLTRNKAYAEKAALFLRRLADEKTGYASTCAGTSMGEPQEGGNFQGVAIAYDAILDAGVLSEDDRRAIDTMLRLYMHNVESALTVGNLGNWSTAADTAALFCALAMGDLAAAERYLYGPSGFTDYLTKGVMDDGWWWEGSTSYNFWVASELTQSALACRAWGIDLLHHEFPANYSPYTIITPWAIHPSYGISFEKWGPSHHNTRSIKQLWDAVPIITDYRGIAFGMNDGHEERVSGSRLELAYFAFRDPVYATLIQRGSSRDLIYGVPELPPAPTTTTTAPPTAATPWRNSGSAENLGFALLRSQTPDRPDREQIQAVFKIGTQGGYHGHFDRASINTLMRYGRSFWNPESIWYGYGNFMYKFFVQCSVNHNMVVVDQMQQEAVPSSQLLFHSGPMMQAVCHETNARWSDPPFGGMVYDARDSGGSVASLPSLMKKNRQSFPLATDRKWGQMGPFTDRVLQRRLGIVTDDYVVIADYLQSAQPHTFDDLFQMKGFGGLDAPGKKLLRHDAQFNADPHSSAQFITDCDWYQASAPSRGRFEFKFGPGAEDPGTQFNEPGTLKVDLHTLWPKQQELMLAQPPETFGQQQWVTYDVSGDGQSLAHGETGTWVLGVVDIDVPVSGLKQLALSIKADAGKKNALFWGNPRLVTADGKEIPLPPAPPADASASDNVLPTPAPGVDYYGGPIKLAGVACTSALPTQPADPKAAAVVRIPLEGRNAVRFKATLGGDYPFGDESQRRKLFAIRSRGTGARFLTLLEPYEDQSVVRSAEAVSPDQLRVTLKDGRVQTIEIQNLAGDGRNINVKITETRDGQSPRSESARQP